MYWNLRLRESRIGRFFFSLKAGNRKVMSVLYSASCLSPCLWTGWTLYPLTVYGREFQMWSHWNARFWWESRYGYICHRYGYIFACIRALFQHFTPVIWFIAILSLIDLVQRRVKGSSEEPILLWFLEMLLQRHILGILRIKYQDHNKIWKGNLLDLVCPSFLYVVLNSISLEVSVFYYQLTHGIFIGI